MIKRCENGHFYESEIFPECPYCSGKGRCFSACKPIPPETYVPPIVRKYVYGVLEPGTVLRNGRYVIENKVASGSFCLIYTAEDTALKLRVTIKEYAMHTINDGWSRQLPENLFPLIEHEIRLNSQADLIPNVVPIRDSFKENGTVYLVRSYVNGHTLREKISYTNRKLNEKEFRMVFLPLIHALQRIHRRSMIHGDVSEFNILIDKEGDPWLTDFDLAMSFSETDTECRQVYFKDLMRTESMYTAPELKSEDQKIGPWTDVYSLCWEMYSCLPHGASKELVRVLKKGMEKEPENRYQSMQELEHALNACVWVRKVATDEAGGEEGETVLPDGTTVPVDDPAFPEVNTWENHKVPESSAEVLIKYELYDHLFSSEEYGYRFYFGAAEVGSASEFNPMLANGIARIRFGNLRLHSDFDERKIWKDAEAKVVPASIERTVYTDSDKIAAKWIFSPTKCECFTEDRTIAAIKSGFGWNFYEQNTLIALLKKSQENKRLNYDNKAFDFFIYDDLSNQETANLLSFPILCLSRYTCMPQHDRKREKAAEARGDEDDSMGALVPVMEMESDNGSIEFVCRDCKRHYRYSFCEVCGAKLDRQMKCNSCGHDLKISRPYCWECNEITQMVCPQCGSGVGIGARRCPFCGYRFYNYWLYDD